MKRWIWTILITLTLGMAVGCGSKKGGSGATPAPADPTNPTDPVNPQCDPNTTNCLGDVQTYVQLEGHIQISSMNSFRKVLKDLRICADNNYNFLEWQFYIGTSSCDTYSDGYIHIGLLGNQGSVHIATRSSWGTWTNYVFVTNGQLYPINQNTGYQLNASGPLAYGHFPPPNPNQLFQVTAENFSASSNNVKLKIRYNNVELGSVNAYVQ